LPSFHVACLTPFRSHGTQEVGGQLVKNSPYDGLIKARGRKFAHGHLALFCRKMV
jgi:hypothetical protein